MIHLGERKRYRDNVVILSRLPSISWIVPLKSHPSAGAECPRGEVEINCAQREAHLDQGACSNFAWDLCSGKHSRRQVLDKTSTGFDVGSNRDRCRIVGDEENCPDAGCSRSTHPLSDVILRPILKLNTLHVPCCGLSHAVVH